MDGDTLTPEQRARAAACYEAARSVLADDPPPDDIITVADYIVTGRKTPDVRVLPDESMIRQVVERLAKTTENIVGPSYDAGGSIPPMQSVRSDFAERVYPPP